LAATDQRRPRDRVQTATMRAWAKDNGWPDLPDRGRLPPEVRPAFEEAHGTPVDEDADVSAMDETDLDDGFAEMQANAAADDYDPADLGPPASLDEARERAGRDPDARHLTTGRQRGQRQRKTRPDQPVIKITKAVQADITGKLAFWLSIPAEPWLRVDPYCGGAYASQVDEIALKMAPLVCQSPDLVRWFSKSSTFIMWTELGIAVRPVAEAIIAHHVTKRISLDSNGGVVEQQRGGMDFSAYSARQPNPAAA
jgi:hypothetical protein